MTELQRLQRVAARHKYAPLNRLQYVHAPAVGAGVTASIQALAKSPDAESEEAWVYFCCTAADEAYAAVMENPPPAPQREGTISRLLRELKEDELGESVPPPPPQSLDADQIEGRASLAAAEAFRHNMPQLTGRRRAKAYLACVAVGTQRGYFTGAEARSLLYVAQLALTANPKRQQTRRQKGKNEQ